MPSPYNYHTFPNGIRLVHRETDGPVAHFAFMVNAGSRDEHPEEQGVAHFIEHMIFKGTEKRSAFQVLNRLENVGADLNAFTTKEDTCVYASLLVSHYEKAVELLSDILFHSVFPSEEIRKERAVVLDELNSYKDNPAEWIHDEFDEVLFPGHTLGLNILGTPAHLKSFTREMILGFRQRQYLTNQIVLSSVGKVPFQKVVRLAGKYFGQATARFGEPGRIVPGQAASARMVRKYGKHQTHVIIGNRAYHSHDDRRIPLALLNNMLGGPAMNSRLNLALREKHGIAYNLESNYSPLSDTGIFSIYFGTDEKMVDKGIRLVNNELQKLRNNSLGANQLHIAKEQLKGQLAISIESNQAEMISMAKSIITFNKVDTIEEIYARIDRVEASVLLEVANEIFDPAGMSSLIFNRKGS